MKRDKEIVTLSVLLLVNLARSDVPYDLFKREEPCNTLCEKIPLFFANNEHVLSCCQRGCRFYNLVDLRGGENLNGTRDACEAACTEAYTELQDRYACSTGCDVMVIQRMSDLLSLFSAPIDIEEIMDSNVLLMSPDMPESDILTDPGLRKELLPRWWDFNGFKLPQTYIKTVPIDAETVEYDIPSDYSGENDQPGSIPGYVLRHIGISDWLLASTAAVALCAIWFCLCSECGKEIRIIDLPIVTLHKPDEVPLQKKPSPKKNIDVIDVIDVIIDVIIDVNPLPYDLSSNTMGPKRKQDHPAFGPFYCSANQS